MKISVNLSPEEIEQIDHLKEVSKANSRGQVIRQMIARMADSYETWWSKPVALGTRESNSSTSLSSNLDTPYKSKSINLDKDSNNVEGIEVERKPKFVPLDKIL